MKTKVIFIFTILFSVTALSQSLDDLDSYQVEEFYKKVELDNDTLDEDGDEIEYIYVKTEVDDGDYKVDLTDADGDLYEIKGTNLFIKFRTYFGYAGYSEECIMKVDYYSATVYKLE